MVNIAGRSGGCIRCRRRRVKCGEERPGCLRCSKLGEPCLGYTTKSWIFCNENDTARELASRRPQINLDRSLKQDDERLSQDLHGSTKSGTSGPEHSSLPLLCRHESSKDEILAADDPVKITMHPGLAIDLEVRSVSLFMEMFTLDSVTEGEDPAHLDFLPKLFLEASEGSCLRKAVLAVAQVAFANRYKARNLLRHAGERYGDALIATNKALRDPSLAVSDGTSAAVWLLGLYELLGERGDQTNRYSGWGNHASGTLQLLRLRGVGQFQRSVGRQLFRLVYLRIMIRSLLLYQEPPAEFARYLEIMERSDSKGSDGASIVSDFLQQTATAQSKIRRSIHKSGEEIVLINGLPQTYELIREASAILDLKRLENWSINKPHWQPKQTHENDPGGTSRTYFDSEWVMSHWLHYITLGFILRQTMIDGLRACLGAESMNDSRVLERSSDCHRSKVQQEINILKQEVEGLATQILGMVDFALGRLDSNGKRTGPKKEYTIYTGSAVGALHCFWSIGTVRHSVYTNSLQKDVASATLRTVGNDVGIAQALVHM